MTSARDTFVIDFEKSVLENRIRLFKNSKYGDEDLHKFFQINKKKGWDIRKAWNALQSISNSELKEIILPVTYRPFDDRYIFWHDSLVWRTVKRVMHHMLQENIGLITPRQFKEEPGAFITENMIGHKTVSAYDINYLFPLYLYPEKTKKDNPRSGSTMMMVFESGETYGKKPNISPIIFKKLEAVFKKEPSPEDILYYIYGVFYSNIYRETYAEFLKIDFPRVPFTANYKLFKEMGKLGKQLADLHLLKSPALDKPIAKYQGAGDNDRIEKVTYKDNEQRIYINKEKYFERMKPEVWNYHIGGYQVLQKYLKDRKGRTMDDAPRYCRIITALSKTIEVQEKIDGIYPEVEKKLIDF